MEIDGPHEWETLQGQAKISGDGRYAMFMVEKKTENTRKRVMTIKSLTDMWECSFVEAAEGQFSTDSKSFMFSDRENVVHYLDLKNRVEIKTFSETSHFFEEIEKVKSTRYAFIRKEVLFPTINPALAEVNVWTYKDARNPDPYSNIKKGIELVYVKDSITGKYFQVTKANESILSVNGDYAIVQYREGDIEETEWNEKARASYYLVSLNNNERSLIAKENSDGLSLKFSDDGNYILICDNSNLKYSSYNIATKSMYDISKEVEIYVTGAMGLAVKNLFNETIFLNDKSAIVRDDYDIWKLDLTGHRSPECLTGGRGRVNRIVFRPVEIVIEGGKKAFLKESFGYLLSVFDEKDKSWGFYTLSGRKGDTAVKASLGPWYFGGENPYILKARNANVYLVKRETTIKAPNWYSTRDFKTFTAISNVNPEKKYKWLNVDLVKWKTGDGRQCEGMLYKPENFDPYKKYPVVTIIYVDFSKNFNRFIQFETEGYGFVNFLPVTWLVSNGYLVFMPDLVNRKPGDALQEACRMLIPGVEYIANLPYVNAQKIGLQGSSWGGIQTNFVITQTNLFAAAYAGAGASDQISFTGYSDQIAKRNRMPNGESRIGGRLPSVEQYIAQSALLYSNRVTTPLLLRHGKNDGAVPFYQSLQYFRWLRRLGKEVWMLQYDTDMHGVPPGKNLNDMNIRISQFFDHYLKDVPAPRWMKGEIPSELRQVESGFELDKPERE